MADDNWSLFRSALDAFVSAGSAGPGEIMANEAPMRHYGDQLAEAYARSEPLSAEWVCTGRLAVACAAMADAAAELREGNDDEAAHDVETAAWWGQHLATYLKTVLP